MLAQGTLDTLVMVFASTAIAYVVGTALGVVLHLTARDGLRPAPLLNAVLGWVVNIGRSLPFIILLIALMPATAALVGTSTGVRGVIPPLVVATAPFVARMVEQSLAEVSRDAVEAAEACGASVPRIVFSAPLPEALPSIVRGIAVTLIAVLGYTAIAGAVGAGGLGDIAIRYGYYRYENEVMIARSSSSLSWSSLFSPRAAGSPAGWTTARALGASAGPALARSAAAYKPVGVPVRRASMHRNPGGGPHGGRHRAAAGHRRHLASFLPICNFHPERMSRMNSNVSLTRRLALKSLAVAAGLVALGGLSACGSGRPPRPMQPSSWSPPRLRPMRRS